MRGIDEGDSGDNNRRGHGRGDDGGDVSETRAGEGGGHPIGWQGGTAAADVMGSDWIGLCLSRRHGRAEEGEKEKRVKRKRGVITLPLPLVDVVHSAGLHPRHRRVSRVIGEGER